MSCYLCSNESYKEILSQTETPIWTNVSDDICLKAKYKCILHQCTNCGHVYQPLSPKLKKHLDEFYQSRYGHGMTPLGKGNWGKERAKTNFFDAIDLTKYQSAIEVGCADGTLLKALKERGFNKLVGIDPSYQKTEESNNISFIKEYADEKCVFPEKYDLIFSVAVFEHIEKINGVLQFCRNNLSEKGELFFVVPNAQGQLENGDPSLFAHQHVHYYTKNSLTFLLTRNGFEINHINSTRESLRVSAKIGESVVSESPKFTFYQEYQKKLENVIHHFNTTIENSRVIIHGANNALNNILKCSEKFFDLVDNDVNKQEKYFFNRRVQSPRNLVLVNYDMIVIIPYAFYEAIKEDYTNLGFKGEIKGIISS